MSLLRDLKIAIADGIYAAGMQVRSRFDRRIPEPIGPTDAPVVALAIPGAWDSWHFMEPLAKLVSKRGIRVHFVPELGHHLMSVSEALPLVARALETVMDEAAGRPVIVLGHSKGGIVGLRLLADRIARNVVQPVGLVALSTPFGGSAWADRTRLGAVRELRLASDTIVQVRKDALSGVRIVSVRPSRDPHITSQFVPDSAKRLRIDTAGHFQTLSTAAGARATVWGIRQLLRDAGVARSSGAFYS